MKSNFRYGMMCFLLLLGAHLLGAPGGAETDSTKNKFPIDDPRNPNCPCHKYQEQADREYAKLLATPSVDKTLLQVKTDAFGGNKKIKRMQARHRFRSQSSTHKVKATKRKCFRDHLSRCFHF